MTHTQLTRHEAMERIAEAMTDLWDKLDIEEAIIEGRVGLEEMSNSELELYAEELLDEPITITGTDPLPLSIRYAAPALYEALKLCERALECRDTEAEEHAAKEARRVIRLAEGGKP